MASDLPKTVVVVLVFIKRGSEILLVRQGYGEKFWSLPGGVLEEGESIDQAAIREVKEETGLDIRLGRLVGVYSKPADNAIALTFEAQVSGGVLHPSNEIIDAQYFSLDHLPGHIRKHLLQRVKDFEAGFPDTVVRVQ